MDLHTVGQYRVLIEHSTDLITVVDEGGVVRFGSPSLETVLGYDPDRFVGENAFEYVHPDDRERVVAAFDEIVESPGRVMSRVEYRSRHADGSWVWLESVATNRTETTLAGYVINSRDVTRRKERERALEEERDRYETLVEQSHDAIAINQDGAFVFANERCLEMLGYEADELIGKSFEDITPPEYRDLVRERYERRLDPEAASPPAQYETTFVTKDGERRVGEIGAARIHYDGRPADLVTVRDVTERKSYEDRLEATTEELEALNRVVRHDIRNDMTIVLGWAQLLETHVDEEGEEYLSRILASGEHIVELTQIAHDYVETLTSEETVPVQPTPLRSTLQTEIELRAESFPEAEFVVVDDLPDVSVVANEMLGSVFRNLLNNAVQHNDTVEPLVEISCETDADDVIVRIADNGPGIPDDRKETIFGKGEKGVESSGTGIGLYLVERLVSQYDGRIWVVDNDPTGAVFAVRLPLTD